MLFDMNRPSPVPVLDFVANFVNSLGNISESMPGPVSVILTTISLVFGTGVILTVPSSVNLIALLRSLKSPD
jgi:hypothetical protein